MSPPIFSPPQIDRLGLAIARVFNLNDFGIVLGRYPGRGEPATFLPAGAADRPMVFVTSRCLKEVDEEGTLIAFLSRVVEHKWDTEAFRWAIFGQARMLVRSADQTAPHVAKISAALQALTPVVAIDPLAKQCGNKTACRLIQDRRADIETVAKTLDQFEALKTLHDCLHVLQVKGADWLDRDDASVDPDLPLAILESIVSAARDAAIAVSQRVPAEALASCKRCADTAADAAARLASGDSNQHDFALVQLRALVIAEQPVLDGCMFALSRDLPIKQLRGLLEAADAMAPSVDDYASAANALDRLLETMRANILEHALWQATELHIHAVAQLFAHPGPGFLTDLRTEWTSVKQNLQLLLDLPTTGLPMDAALNAAMLLYERALPTAGMAAPSGPTPKERFGDMVRAFNEFRPKARLRFLAVDQTLKSVFSGLLPLRASLDGLGVRVPYMCDCSP